MGKTRTKTILSVAILLATSVRVFALDPSLDVSQYAHTAWKIRDGFTRAASLRWRRRLMVICGWARHLACFASMVSGPSVAAARRRPTSQPADRPLLVARDGTLWIATDKGLASWRNGKLTTYPEVAGRRVDSVAARCRRNGLVWRREPRQAVCHPSSQNAVLRSRKFRPVRIRLIRRTTKAICGYRAQTGLWRWAPGHPEHYTVPGKEVQARRTPRRRQRCTSDGLHPARWV